MKIKDILDINQRPLIKVQPDDLLSDAIKKMVDHNRGSIAVSNDAQELIGIITERDIVRKCVARNCNLKNTQVKEIMTEKVAVGFLEDTIEYAIGVMKQKRIRHLPVIDNEKVIGIISMRDLLDVQLGETEAKIRYAELLPKKSYRPIV